MVHFLVISVVKRNIHEAKTHLSAYLDRLRPGEVIVLCKRNKPIAEIRLLPEDRSRPRPIGLARGEFEVPDAFFEPLPDDLLDAFGAPR